MDADGKLSRAANNSSLEIELEQVPAPQEETKKKACRLSRCISIAAIILALLLVLAAIWMHLRQKSHLGRLHIKPAKIQKLQATELFELVTVAAVAAYNEEQPQQQPPKLLSAECLQCIAKTTTNLKPAICSGGVACGYYRISQMYWQDAQKAANQTYGPGMQDYASCVASPECADQVVRSYMDKYMRDCNDDGLIDCRDFILLHLRGPNGCFKAELQPVFMFRMNECLRYNKLL